MEVRVDSNLWRRYETYCQELKAIETRIPRVPPGKREKLHFRLIDIKSRLIPDLVTRIRD